MNIAILIPENDPALAQSSCANMFETQVDSIKFSSDRSDDDQETPVFFWREEQIGNIIVDSQSHKIKNRYIFNIIINGHDQDS